MDPARLQRYRDSKLYDWYAAGATAALVAVLGCTGRLHITPDLVLSFGAVWLLSRSSGPKVKALAVLVIAATFALAFRAGWITAGGFVPLQVVR